jgi:hypothetical protein
MGLLLFHGKQQPHCKIREPVIHPSGRKHYHPPLPFTPQGIKFPKFQTYKLNHCKHLPLKWPFPTAQTDDDTNCQNHDRNLEHLPETKTIFENLGKSKGIWERCNLSIVALEQKKMQLFQQHTKWSSLFCVGIVTHSNKTFAIEKTRYTLGRKYHGNLDTKSYYFKGILKFSKKNVQRRKLCEGKEIENILEYSEIF